MSVLVQSWSQWPHSAHSSRSTQVLLSAGAKVRPGGQKQTPPVRDGPHLYSQPMAGQERVAGEGGENILSVVVEREVQAESEEYLQHAVSSSAPSSQSRLPSHSFVSAMHLGFPPAPPLGQRNWLSRQAIVVQLVSSLSSAQSRKPSQWNLLGMHTSFVHRYWPVWHGGKSEEGERGKCFGNLRTG